MRAFCRPAVFALLLYTLLSSCTTAPAALNPIPQPSASERLRVFVQPLESSGNWRLPYEEYARASMEKVSQVWFNTGIYEVVAPADADAVLGRSGRSLRWKADNYELARRVGAALWAEYTMLLERVQSGAQFFYDTTLINAATGAVFKVTMRVPGGTREDYQPIVQATYRQLFVDARQDMLATATRKRQSGGGGAPSDAAASASPSAAPAPAAVARTLDFTALEGQSSAESARVPLAVHDVDAREEDRLVARILSEALRAELIGLGRFRLVSREALDKVLQELSLQQTGLVDEKQAARVGRGLAVKQIVVGSYGSLGSLSVLQLKRVDVESQQAVGAASLQCPTGKEEQLLLGMPGLAAALSADR